MKYLAILITLLLVGCERTTGSPDSKDEERFGAQAQQIKDLYFQG